MSKKTVVVGLDGSDLSRKGLDRVLAEAETREMDIILVSVAEALAVFSVRPDYVEFLDQVLAEAQDILDQGLARAGEAGRQARGVVESGRPAAVISDIARRENADEIVVGSLGKHAVDKLLLGSVSSRLLQTAACTVVVVR